MVHAYMVPGYSRHRTDCKQSRMFLGFLWCRWPLRVISGWSNWITRLSILHLPGRDCCIVRNNRLSVTDKSKLRCTKSHKLVRMDVVRLLRIDLRNGIVNWHWRSNVTYSLYIVNQSVTDIWRVYEFAGILNCIVDSLLKKIKYTVTHPKKVNCLKIWQMWIQSCGTDSAEPLLPR